MSPTVCQSSNDLLTHDSAKGKPMAVSMVPFTPFANSWEAAVSLRVWSTGQGR